MRVGTGKMNPYTKNIDRIEFVMTYACTGKCKHCSEGNTLNRNERIDGKVAADTIKILCKNFNIKTVMTFGGEPLLCIDEVCQIHKTAKEMGIPKRQVITNGYFSKDINIIKDTAKKLSECGVNDLLLSVDAFHQESIPLDIVKVFAAEIKKNGVPIRLNPAWLVSKEDKNPYNIITEEIIKEFEAIEIFPSDGNIIFPEGNALKYLKDYFNTDETYINPYAEDPKDIRTVSISPNGDVLTGNLYENSIMEIIKKYVETLE